jgi:hypothetical protein
MCHYTQQEQMPADKSAVVAAAQRVCMAVRSAPRDSGRRRATAQIAAKLEPASTPSLGKPNSRGAF